MGYGLGELMRLLALGKPCVSNCLAVCYVVKPFRTTTSDAETTSDGQLNDNEWLLYRLVPSHVVLPSLGTLVVFGLPVVSFPTQDDKAVTELRQLRNASCGLFQGMGYGLGELMRLLALGKPCVRSDRFLVVVGTAPVHFSMQGRPSGRIKEYTIQLLSGLALPAALQIIASWRVARLRNLTIHNYTEKVDESVANTIKEQLSERVITPLFTNNNVVLPPGKNAYDVIDALVPGDNVQLLAAMYHDLCWLGVEKYTIQLLSGLALPAALQIIASWRVARLRNLTIHNYTEKVDESVANTIKEQLSERVITPLFTNNNVVLPPGKNAYDVIDALVLGDNVQLLAAMYHDLCWLGVETTLHISSLNSTVLILTWQHQLDLAALICLGSTNQQHQRLDGGYNSGYGSSGKARILMRVPYCYPNEDELPTDPVPSLCWAILRYR
nr:cytochrome c oxidase [Tanacetum cinerariifolium]